jgi:DNA-binding NarL/FixJ family response regulator
MEQIKIGLVEDHVLFRTGIKAILDAYDDLSVVFEAGDGFSVIEKLKSELHLPDVMLVDLSLPASGKKEYSGEQLTIDLETHFPDMKIIILTVHRDESYIAQLIKTGAHGYLLKDTDPEELYLAIKTVHTKGSYINELTLKAIQRNMGKQLKQFKPFADITRREMEILQLTCLQYTAEEIAEKLFISIKTVNGHRTNLLQKTGTRNVAGLVYYAVSKGLIEELPV